MDTERNSSTRDFSRATDGEAAHMNMGAVAEIHDRLSKLERDNANLRDALNNARNSGAVPYPGFTEHVAHVMGKYHAGDKPEGFDEKYPLHGDERSASEFGG